MSERIPASIQFGGKISRADAEELVKLVNEEGLDPDWGDSGEITIEDLDKVLGHSEVKYGTLDDLVAFAVNHSLAYLHWWDSGSEWNQGFAKRDGAGRYGVLDGTPDNPLFSVNALRTHGAEKLLELADWAAQPLPKLEILP